MNIPIAAKAQAYNWLQSFGGSKYDAGYAVVQDKKGNTWLTGTFSGTAKFGDQLITSAGNEDLFIAKCNSDGKIQWVTRAGATGSDYGYDLISDGNGDIYVTGGFVDSISFGNLRVANTDHLTRTFLLKMDSNGSPVWLKQITGGQPVTTPNVGIGLAADLNGMVYLTGSFTGSIRIDGYDLASSNRYYEEDVYLIKLSPLGKVIWLQKAEGLDQDTVADIAVAPNGEIVITGRYRYGIHLGSIILPETGLYENYLAKFDTNGNVVWAEHFGMPQVDYGEFSNSVATDYAGKIYVTGNFIKRFQAGGKEYSGEANNVYLVKFDENGKVEWVRTGGGNGYDEGHKVFVDDLGNPFVGGVISGLARFGDTYTSGNGLYSSMFLAKYNTQGDLLWVNGFGSNSANDCKSFYVRQDGKCVLTGYFSGTISTGNQVVSAFGENDIFFAQMQFNQEIQILSVDNDLNPLCTGPPIQVHFRANGNFSTDNAFSIELSDRSGNFTQPPTIIGSGQSSPLSIRIPGSTLPGNNYRIRALSSIPYLIGYEYTRTLIISQIPEQPVIATPDATTMCAGDSIQLVAPTGFSNYLWSNQLTTQRIYAKTSGNYSVIVSNGSGCDSPASLPVQLTVMPVIKKPAVVRVGEDSLMATVAGTSYEWRKDDQMLATNAAYIQVKAPGSYQVRVYSKEGCVSEYADAYTISPAVASLEQHINFPPIEDKVFGNTPFNLNASSSSGLPITVKLTGPATLNNNLITLVGAGTVAVAISQPCNNLYKAAMRAERSFTVAKANQIINFPELTDKLSNAPSFLINATASSGLPVDFSVESGPAVLSNNMVSLTGAGQVKIKAFQPGNENYQAAPEVERSFLVNAVLAVERAVNSAVKIYPNPIHRQFTVELPTSRKNYSLNLLNSQGQLIFNTENFGQAIVIVDVVRLPKGIYLLKIQNKEVNESYKLIVE